MIQYKTSEWNFTTINHLQLRGNRTIFHLKYNWTYTPSHSRYENISFCLSGICCIYLNTYSQEDGRIISKTSFVLPQNVVDELKSSYNEKIVSEILALNYYRITYMSDSLKVTGYLVAPKENQKYPCIIFNRGGNKEFGQWNPKSIAVWLGATAIWGYVVIASQYRGNDGGEGTEDFGGRDVNDVLNLIPVLEQQPNADTSRIGIEGWSRGGMMTYIALTKICKFKAAVVGAGLANAFTQISRRPEMEERVFSKLIPNYNNRKQEELTKRSAVFWAKRCVRQHHYSLCMAPVIGA